MANRERVVPFYACEHGIPGGCKQDKVYLSAADLKIRACHRHEMEAMKTEFEAVARGDHDAASKAHADRRHWINEAGKIIDGLPGGVLS